MRQRMTFLAALLVAVAAGCGGGSADDDDAAPGPSSSSASTPVVTAEPADTTPPDIPVVDERELSAECRAALAELLQVIEPYVQGLTASDVTEGTLDADGMAAASAASETRVESVCPPIDNREAFETMIDIARSAAPGAVWYLEFVTGAGAAE